MDDFIPDIEDIDNSIIIAFLSHSERIKYHLMRGHRQCNEALINKCKTKNNRSYKITNGPYTAYIMLGQDWYYHQYLPRTLQKPEGVVISIVVGEGEPPVYSADKRAEQVPLCAMPFMNIDIYYQYDPKVKILLECIERYNKDKNCNHLIGGLCKDCLYGPERSCKTCQKISYIIDGNNCIVCYFRTQKRITTKELLDYLNKYN